MDIYFAHSFKSEDKTVNDFFKAICSGFGLMLKSVDSASPLNPSDAAIKQIKESKFVVAIAVKRNKIQTEDDEWEMPPSVHQEIVYADGLGKKLILFCEKGVKIEGFLDKICTHHVFERDNLYESLAQYIKSINAIVKEVNSSPLQKKSNKDDVHFNNEPLSNIKTKKNRIEKDGIEVNDDEFYTRLKEAVTNAQQSVYLTTHQKTRPDKGTKTREDYFTSLDMLIKSNRVTVRRIIPINSKEKLEWVNEMIQEFKGCQSLHIRHTKLEDEGFIRALSLQIVDSKKVFIASIGTGGEMKDEDRNIIIETEVLCKAFQHYYQSYWNDLADRKNNVIKERAYINHELLDEFKAKFEK